jgi:single-stranded-DNA-specific exonuclease
MHANAFGISFLDSNLQSLREYFNTHLSAINYNDNEYQVDCEFLPTDNWLIPTIAQIDNNKGIWGKGVEEPLLYIRGIPLKHKDIIAMGKNADSTKFNCDGVAYVKFKDVEFHDNLMMAEEPIYLNVVAKANMNNWQGHSTPQLIIQDYTIENIYDF